MIKNLEKSQKYRERVHKLIPGGCHTYSKGDDNWPLNAPAAIARGEGAYVWDIDNNKYLDCSMGLTSVSLGHAYPQVLEAVKKCLNNGVNFQRPSYLELEMAETFLDLIPFHNMIKFAKNGSTVTTAAVKLCRAATNRKYVAFPSDHPFYSYDDWFIGKTVCNKGVPSEISDLSLTFESKNLKTLEDLFKKYPEQIACVITEPEKNFLPETYLSNVKNICSKYKAKLIADEMITGFKTSFPGSITKLNVEVDLATWGKGIANGFSFCALTGKQEIMTLGGITNTGSEKVFLISSTHGGETHSISAGLATIEIFKSKNVIEHNHKLGNKFCVLMDEAINNNDLIDYIKIQKNSWMPLFEFYDQKKELSLPFKTLMMQEMIERGVLFQGAFVPCFSHTEQDLIDFRDAFNESLKVYQDALIEGIDQFLKGDAMKPVFRKLI